MPFDPIVRAIIDIGILIAFAKVMAGVMMRLNLPEVLGELLAGIVLGPFALGSLQLAGEPLVAFNEHVLAFGEIGAIVILFAAGLEVGFKQFRAQGAQSLTIGASGVLIICQSLAAEGTGDVHADTHLEPHDEQSGISGSDIEIIESQASLKRSVIFSTRKLASCANLLCELCHASSGRNAIPRTARTNPRDHRIYLCIRLSCRGRAMLVSLLTGKNVGTGLGRSYS